MSATHTTTSSALKRQGLSARFWWVGIAYHPGAVAVNTLIALAAHALLTVAPTSPLQFTSLIPATAVAVAGALVVFAVISRRSSQPVACSGASPGRPGDLGHPRSAAPALGVVSGYDVARGGDIAADAPGDCAALRQHGTASARRLIVPRGSRGSAGVEGDLCAPHVATVSRQEGVVECGGTHRGGRPGGRLGGARLPTTPSGTVAIRGRGYRRAGPHVPCGPALR